MEKTRRRRSANRAFSGIQREHLSALRTEAQVKAGNYGGVSGIGEADHAVSSVCVFHASHGRIWGCIPRISLFSENFVQFVSAFSVAEFLLDYGNPRFRDGEVGELTSTGFFFDTGARGGKRFNDGRKEILVMRRRRRKNAGERLV
jgi:hypothetical protein